MWEAVRVPHPRAGCSLERAIGSSTAAQGWTNATWIDADVEDAVLLRGGATIATRY